MDRAPLKIVDDEDGTLLELMGIEYQDQLLTYAAPNHKDIRIKLSPSHVMKEFATERRIPEKTEIVRQGKYECAAASLAMVTGHTLFNVKRVMGKHGWRNDNSGAGFKLLQSAARDFGCDLLYAGRNVIRIMREDMPTCMVCLTSLNVPKMGHGVAWVNGEIIDPNFGDKKRRYWGAEWAPWTMGAHGIELLVPGGILKESIHKEFRQICKRGDREEIRRVVLELTG